MLSTVPEPVGRDLDRTRAQLEAWLRPRLGARDLRVSPLRAPAGSGFSNDTLLFDAAWREGGAEREQGFVARIKPSGFPIFPEYDVGRQYRVMKALEPSDVPVPRVRWNEPDASFLGAPFYVMERLWGRVPPDSPPYHVGGFMTALSEPERAAIWMNGLEVMTRIHRLDPVALGLGFLARPELGDTPLDQQLACYERYLEWAARGREQPVAEAALEWLRGNRPAGGLTGLSWGDSRIGNIMYLGCEPVGVLDWEMAALGDPEQDLAWFLFVDRVLSEGAGLPRLPGLPGRDATIDRYQELVGRAVRHLHFYEVWAGFRFAVIMIRLMQRAAAYGGGDPGSSYAAEKRNMVTVLLAGLLDLPPP